MYKLKLSLINSIFIKKIIKIENLIKNYILIYGY